MFELFILFYDFISESTAESWQEMSWERKNNSACVVIVLPVHTGRKEISPSDSLSVSDGGYATVHMKHLQSAVVQS